MQDVRMSKLAKLCKDVAAYAERSGVSPATVVVYATGQSYAAYSSWVEGKTTCTLETEKIIRDYMAGNRPKYVRPGLER